MFSFLKRLFGGVGPVVATAALKVAEARVREKIDSRGLSETEKALAHEVTSAVLTELNRELNKPEA